MNKIYQRIDWENYPSSATPLNEDNLNKMDYAIDKLDDRVVAHETTKLDTATGNSLVKDVTFDETTGIFTIEKLSGSKITINTALEKISTNFHFNPTTQKLVLTLIDGTVQEIDLSALITQYEFLESDTIAFTVDSNGKVTASVKNGSITGDKLEPNYLADVTLQANNAKTSADNAKTSEELAYQYAEDARESASQTQKNNASNITYDNSTSGLEGNNVQSVIDELSNNSVSNDNVLLTLAECLVSSLDKDVVGAKVMTEINNALNGKMNYAELTSENINSTFTNHIAMGVVDNNLYITMGYSWINFQFRVHSSGWLYRIAYGSSGWGDWHNGSIDIDNTLSTTSTNPLQNKVITTSLNNKADKTSVLSTLTECEASTKNTDIVGASALAELSDKIGTILYSAMVSSSKNIETSTSVLLGGVAFEKGTYVVDAYVRWSSTNTAGIRSIALLNHQNPTYELYAFPESDIMIPDGMPSTCGQHIQTIFSFEQTTTMYFYIKQNSGSTIPIDMAYVKAIKLK